MLLGPKNKLGAAVDIATKKAGGGPVEVRLQPTGSARLRFHDAQGKIIPSYNPNLELVVSPGPTFSSRGWLLKHNVLVLSIRLILGQQLLCQFAFLKLSVG